MARVYDKPLAIQRIDEASEDWVDVWNLHAYVNKARGSDEYLSGGAIQSKKTLTFEVRYFAALEDVSYNTQRYRIVYHGVVYDIDDYDDYLEQHKTVKLLASSTGARA